MCVCGTAVMSVKTMERCSQSGLKHTLMSSFVELVWLEKSAVQRHSLCCIYVLKISIFKNRPVQCLPRCLCWRYGKCRIVFEMGLQKNRSSYFALFQWPFALNFLTVVLFLEFSW